MAAEGMEEKSNTRGETVDEETKPTTQTTIFVGNLPFDTRDDDLEKEFSDFGPIKRAFIVKDKDKKSKSRGCGYVQFVLQEDADKCAKASKSIGSRKLRLSYANKKPKHLKRKAAKEAEEAKENGDDKENSENNSEENKAETKTDVEPPSPKVKKPNPKPKTESSNEKSTEEPKSDGKTDIQKTIVLTGLTAKVKRKAFRILCEGFGEIENIVYPVPERDEVTAFVRFKEYKSAIRATQKIPGKKVKKSGVLSACLLTKENKHPSKKQMQKSRLIIRNLSFKCEEEHLTEIFSKFGKILNMSIPTKKVNGKDVKIGCAFVQYAHAENAKAALEGMNLKEIKDRQVVVDWAVAKDVYKEKVNEENKKEASKEEKTEEKPKKEKKMKEKQSKDVEGDTKDEKKETKKEKKKKGKQDNQDEEEEDKLEDETISDEGESEDELNDTADNEEEDNEEEDDDEEDEKDDDEEEGESDGEEEDGEMDEDGEEDIEDEEEEVKEKPKKEMKDAKEGKTIFIRNLSYDVDQDMLAEEFESFGEIDYCKVVQDYETGRSKGTAFLKFKTKESADKCLEEFERKEKSGVNTLIDGRAINVSLAVTKGKLGEMQRVKSDERKETDKRNLYLAAEGIITRNSPAAEGLTDADFKKREKSLAEKKAKLKNPNYFVSRTRLCLKNLPVSTDADSLRVALMKYAPREANIKEIKIMRSKDRRDVKGVPRSLGFGFIDLETHEDALALLRATNNNPEIFGPKRRPIVEFSVENSKALKILELKKKRSDVKTARNEQNVAGNEDEDDKPEIDKKALKEKIHEKRLKRIARYKKKREQKKLERANQDGENVTPAAVTNIADDKTNDKKSPVKNKDQNKKNQNKKNSRPENKKVSAPQSNETTNNRGFKRKLPVELTETSVAKRAITNRNAGKKKVVKEEEKFNKMVQQYKQKLFGDKKVTSGGNKKKEGSDRWFE